MGLARQLAGRTVQEFKVEIKDHHIIQRELMECVNLYYKQNRDKELTIEDNGVDNSGEYVEPDKLNSEADFLVNGKKFEVKFFYHDRKVFRLKYMNLLSYVKQDAYICIINGYGTDNPRFAIIGKEKLKKMYPNKKKNWKIYPYNKWEGKWVMVCYDYEFKWYPLPINDEELRRWFLSK